jgi:hypothetical protein
MIRAITLSTALLAFAAVAAFSANDALAAGPYAYYGPPICAPLAPPPPIYTVLKVANPCCCGDYACVKVCLPACCTCPPKVCERCGLFQRGIVTYEWPCGHRVTVVFTRLRGVVVHQS